MRFFKPTIVTLYQLTAFLLLLDVLRAAQILHPFPVPFHAGWFGRVLLAQAVVSTALCVSWFRRRI